MKLNNENIDKTVEDIRKFFERAKVSKRDLLKINLIAEESLLRWQENFGEEQEFSLKTRYLFGTPKVIIRLKGLGYNPLESQQDEEIFSAQVMQNLLNYETAGTFYEYKGGYNELTIFSTTEKKPLKIPGGSITVAILLAIIFSLAVGQLPQDAQNFIVEKIAKPLFDRLMDLIMAITVPMIFVSVAASICVLDDITTLSNLGLRVIKRFMVITLFIIFTTMFVCEIFFPVATIEGNSDLLLEQFVNLAFSMIPDNLFKPFVEGNILQVVLIAFATGAYIIILDKRAAGLKSLIFEAQQFINKVAESIMHITPLIIFLGIFSTLLTVSTESVLSAWKIIAAFCITYFLISVIMLLRLKLKYKISLRDFIKKNSKTFTVALTIASGTVSMMTNFEVCKKDLKIDAKLCDFWIPMSHSLFAPGKVPDLVVLVFFGAAFSGITISLAQLLMLAFLSVQLAIASPRGYGGIVAIYMLVVEQFNISEEVVAIMIFAGIFIVNVASMYSMIVRNCELYDLAHEVKLDAAEK